MNCVMNRNMSMNMMPSTISSFTTKPMATPYVQCGRRCRRNLVIFDWDDTLFPTTALVRNKEKVTGLQLQQFGYSAFYVLTQYITTFSAENIFIVTNGKHGWVQKSISWLSQKQRTLNPQGVDYWALIQQMLATFLSGHVISA